MRYAIAIILSAFYALAVYPADRVQQDLDRKIKKLDAQYAKFKTGYLKTAVASYKKLKVAETKKGNLEEAMRYKKKQEALELEIAQLTESTRVARDDDRPVAISRPDLRKDKYKPGIVVSTYAPGRRQAKDPMVYVREADLGKPTATTVVVPDKDPFKVPSEKEMNTIAKGYLKVDKSGKYGFTVYGHYSGNAFLTIDRKRISQADTKRGAEVTYVNLHKGFVPIMVEGRIGNRIVTLQWIPADGKSLVPIPADRYYYKPAK